MGGGGKTPTPTDTGPDLIHDTRDNRSGQPKFPVAATSPSASLQLGYDLLFPRTVSPEFSDRRGGEGARIVTRNQ